MEQTVVFEQKVFLTPKDMNKMATTNLDEILLEHLRDSLENKCSQHGFVIPGTLELISRSMGQLDNGRFTAQPTNHLLVQDKSFITESNWPKLKRQTEIWSVDNGNEV